MRKTLKAILIAGLLAGLAVQPALAADFIQQGATRIIRINEDGTTSGQTADAVSYEYGPGMEAAQAAAEAEAQAEAQAAAEAAALAEAEAAAQAEAEAAAEAAANLPAGIRPLDPTKPMIALTFDDGPNASVGNRIMNVMNQYGGRCTFFLVGSRVPTYAAEVQRMAAEGFEIANHTQDHKYLNKLDGASIRAQVEACNNTIQAVAGIRPTIMRLPGGNKNSTVMANVNMPIILWNVDTLDWKTRNAQSNINAVLGKVKDGDIILMHELYGATADAVEVLVPALTEQGFQLVTVSELAYYKGVSMNPGQIYSRMP